MALVELDKTCHDLCKPIYVGFSVLDLSKLFMFDTHYGLMRTLFSDMQLLYTDTDSLIYEARGQNPYEILKSDTEHFDTSDFPLDNVYNIPQRNKKKLGALKDEVCGDLVLEFAGLRPRTYSYLTSGDVREHKKAKGVTKGALKTLRFEDYKRCLFQELEIYRNEWTIKSDR